MSDVSALIGSRLTLAHHSRQSDSSSCDAVPACDAKLMSWRSNMIPNNESNLLRGRTVRAYSGLVGGDRNDEVCCSTSLRNGLARMLPQCFSDRKQEFLASWSLGDDVARSLYTVAIYTLNDRFKKILTN